MNKRKMICFVCVLVIMVGTLTGCSIGKRQVYFASKSGWHTVFKIGDMSCSLKEAKVYLANYKNLYGVIDETDLWLGDFPTDTMESSLKDAAITHLTKVYLLNQYAADHEIALTDKEEDKVKAAAKEYYESLNKEERRYTKANKKDIVGMYERYALAEKVYQSLMTEVDEEVSEDEARVMDAYVLFVTDQGLADQIAVKIQNGATFERLASTYNEADSINATFGRGVYPQAVDDVVFQLEDGECSGKITTDDGYYFFQCIHKYDEQKSENNKVKIIQERKQNVIDDIVNELDKKYYSDMNTKLWEKVSIDKNKKIKTDSFFAVLDKYVSF